jgi:hypothetical protein
MRRFLIVLAFFAVAGAVGTTQAQNLLTNGDLESTPFDVYYDGFTPSAAGDVPGWNLFLGAADGSYVYVHGVGSGNVLADLQALPTQGGMETAALSRPPVTAGQSYLASLTTDNYFPPTLTSYFIDWFDGGGSLLSSSGGGPLGDPNGPFVFAPTTQSFSVSAVAPAGAVRAGVRLITGDAAYSGLTADNFNLSQVPEPCTASLIGLAGLVLVNFVRRRR